MILSAVLPILTKISNAVIKSDYLKLLAAKLSTDMDAVLTESKKYSDTSKSPISSIVPMPKIQPLIDTENRYFMLNVDREVFENAPGFDKDNWPQMTSREWISNIYRYYDVPPYWS